MSDALLAQLSDVEARIARTLSNEERGRVGQLLIDASAKFRLRSGQQFTPGTSTVKLKVGRGGAVVLPQRPVTEITSVKTTRGSDVPYTFTEGADELCLADLTGALYAFEYEPYRTPHTHVVVTYEHGSDEVPDAVVGVVCQMAARAFGRPPEQTGITQENVDGYGYSAFGPAGSAAASGALGMLAAELEVADSYRRPGQPISMLP